MEMTQLFPALPPHDTRNSRLGDPKDVPDGLLAFATGISGLDLCDLERRQLCSGMLFSAKPWPAVASLFGHIARVICRGAKEQVVWPDTGWGVADVADLQSWRNGSVGEFPCEPVGQVRDVVLSAPGSERPITVLGSCARPEPACLRSIDALPHIARGIPGRVASTLFRAVTSPLAWMPTNIPFVGPILLTAELTDGRNGVLTCS